MSDLEKFDEKSDLDEPEEAAVLLGFHRGVCRTSSLAITVKKKKREDVYTRDWSAQMS